MERYNEAAAEFGLRKDVGDEGGGVSEDVR